MRLYRSRVQPVPLFGDRQGRLVVSLVLQGAAAGEALPKWGQSQEPFDLSFKEKIVATYGIDFNAPPPGPALTR